MKRSVLMLIIVVFSVRIAAADIPYEGNASSSSHSDDGQPEPSVAIVSECEDSQMDEEERFWCTVDLAIREGNVSYCTGDTWGMTRECLNEVKKEILLTAEHCKAFKLKRYQDYCQTYLSSQ